MNCWHCNTELIWGGDHDIDDVEDKEYDMITNLTCPKCESYVCLLYTSPSPRDRQKSRMPSSA